MLKLSANAKCGIAVTLGFATLAGISVAIQAATGLLAWYVSYHAFLSPEYYGIIALTAGAIAGLGCSLGLGFKTVGSAFTTLGVALSLGALAYGMGILLRSNYFIEMTALGAFVHAFLFFGTLTGAACAVSLRDR